MAVLTAYFGKILSLPMKIFETTAFGVLGDRLTTSRNRAAQDQRAIDRSPNVFDHLSSFKPIGGLMHYCLNFIQAILSVHWGSPSTSSPVSLSTFQSILPNHSEINSQKVDYYVWLRFLEVIFRGLVLHTALTTLNVSTVNALGDKIFRDPLRLEAVAISVVDNFILATPSRLEADGVKKLKGSTNSGNAVLLLRDIATLREMRDTIKRGHPTRIVQVVKYWAPMFYSAGSYNYSNKCMEVLHCFTHDWPSDFVAANKAGLVVNPHGKHEDCKETDIRVKHFNNKIKERAVGSNATPAMLSKITPAMGYSQDLTDKIFRELGVEKINQTHTHVTQQKDVGIILEHLRSHKIFDFANDKSTAHAIPDLYTCGLEQLSGPQGGHARHLARH